MTGAVFPVAAGVALLPGPRSAQIFMGQALEIEVADIVDPDFTAVARIRKALLPAR